MPVSASNLVSARPVSPLMRIAYLSATRSSQPQRRGRPVVVPYSPPAYRIRSPTSSSSSLGNGPEPTRVAYAFAIPHTSSISFGPTPAPAQAPPPLRLPLRPPPRARPGRARHGVRRRDEWICAVVNVEQRALRALEDHE